MRNILIVCGLLFVSGCSTPPSGEAFSKANIQAAAAVEPVIVAFKAQRTFAVPRDTDVLVNGRKFCVLPENAFVILPVNAGPNKIGFSLWDSPGTSEKVLEVKPGTISYLWVDYNLARAHATALGPIGSLTADEEIFATDGPYVLKQVPSELAEDMLKLYRQHECKK